MMQIKNKGKKDKKKKQNIIEKKLQKQKYAKKIEKPVNLIYINQRKMNKFSTLFESIESCFIWWSVCHNRL